MRKPARPLSIALLLVPLAGGVSAQSPIAVSPGQPDRFAPAGRCPTFAWASPEPMGSVELLVYEIEGHTEATGAEPAAPVLRITLPGAASAWTPPLDACLTPGKKYSWLLRDSAGEDAAARLSEPRLFAVPAAPAPEEVARAMRVLHDYLATARREPGAPAEETGSAAGGDGGRAAPRAGSTPTPRALDPFAAALAAAQDAVAGIAHGVVGTTASAAGAALAGDNTAGGPDLLLGAATAAESAAVTEASLERESPSDLTFDFRNTGAGSMTLRVDSVDVLTTATGAAGAHQHAGEDVTSGTVAEPRIDAAIARDAEILPTVLAGDGAGSGLDADLLDGSDASAFAPAAGSASYVAKGGDTMTGGLVLPADGLTVGTDQLVADSGRVGIATATPDHPLHLEKFLNGAHLIAAIENTGPFSAAALKLKTPAAGNDWNLVAQETGGGVARGLEVQNPSFALPPLAIDATSGFVGIGKLSPGEALDVAGNAKATAFLGDGSQLTGLPAAADVDCAGCVSEAELDFATATQAELDGHEASGAHDAAYLNTGGDTATGTLTLSPAAGDALVTTAGDVGIGTASPDKPLHVRGIGAIFNMPDVAAPISSPFVSIETDVFSSATGILSVLDRRQQTVVAETPTLLVQNTSGATAATNPLIEARAAGATRMVLQQDGRLGLQTGAPDHPFHLEKFLNGAHLIASIENTGPFSAAALQLKTPAAGNEWNLVAQETGAGVARGWEVQNPSFVTPPLSISAANGNVGVNILSAADKLQVAGDIRVGTGTNGCVKDADGSVIAGICSSDARLKRNIAPLAGMLERVARLVPVSFTWRADEFPHLALGDKTQIGLVAQQVAEVLPELVAEDADGFLRVSYSELPLLLLQALREQEARNAGLERALRRLSERLAALEDAGGRARPGS